MLKIYLLLSLINQIFTLTLYKPTNLLSQTKMLFDSNTSTLSYRNFTIIYSQALQNTPSIFYGINNYQTVDRFYYQNIQIFIAEVKKERFILTVNPIQITSIKKFSICYLAIDDPVNFAILTKSFLNPLPYSGHKSNRSVTIHESYNFTNLTANGMLMIKGFYVQSITQFYINTQITNIGSRNYTITVSTSADCSINRLDLSLLFYFTNLIVDDYAISIHRSLCLQTSTNTTIYPVILQANLSIFLLGISAFSGATPQSYVNIGWKPINDPNNTIHVDINAINLQYLCYNFIQIYALKPFYVPISLPTPTNITTNSTPIAPPPSSTTQTDSSDPSGYLIIIIAIVSTSTIIFIIICSIRRFWLSKYYEKDTLKQTKKQLSLASIHQLPALNF